MGIFGGKPQRFKAVIKMQKMPDGSRALRPTGEVRQTNKRTQGVVTAAKHGAVKKIKGQK